MCAPEWSSSPDICEKRRHCSRWTSSMRVTRMRTRRVNQWDLRQLWRRRRCIRKERESDCRHVRVDCLPALPNLRRLRPPPAGRPRRGAAPRAAIGAGAGLGPYPGAHDPAPGGPPAGAGADGGHVRVALPRRPARHLRGGGLGRPSARPRPPHHQVPALGALLHRLCRGEVRAVHLHGGQSAVRGGGGVAAGPDRDTVPRAHRVT
mmetsp:Transcript_29069/g.61073  ORF Transcript_29069/g.61073 Transcript_29069/m.61073 type:complete len:206 (+) Transcript_29069:294-911(+)